MKCNFLALTGTPFGPVVIHLLIPLPGLHVLRVQIVPQPRVDVPIGTGATCPRGTELTAIVQTLATRVKQAQSLVEIRKKDLHAGDRVLVTTRNSLYKIWVLDEGVYWVSGGWFDLQCMSPQRTAINGCTWGGSAIKQDILVGFAWSSGTRFEPLELERFA